MATQTAPSKTVVKAPVVNGVRGRHKKEDMAFSIGFLDDKNTDSSRVPNVVTAVKVVTSDKKSKAINLKDIPPQVIMQFAAIGMRQKLNFFLKDVSKENVSSAAGLIDEFIKMAKNATIFVPKEGGGPGGRSFDADFWVAVMERTAALKVQSGNTKVKLMDDATKKALKAKLLSRTPAERGETTKKWLGDKVVKIAQLQIRTERENTKLGSTTGEYDALTDL